jgi:hypothetical protein
VLSCLRIVRRLTGADHEAKMFDNSNTVFVKAVQMAIRVHGGRLHCESLTYLDKP